MATVANKIYFFVFLIITNFSTSLNGIFVFQKETKFELDVPTLIRSEGYPSERHKVLTQDGYVLELHRIPHGKSSPPPFDGISGGGKRNKLGDKRRPVAFLVHCFLCTSSIWVMQGPEQGLGYMLADHGYDVWMMNTRGSSYSHHLKYTTKDRQFWNFSWHESGVYDLPASIDYVLGATNHTQLTYIGFSMGTTIFFVAASTRPDEFYRKIEKAIALAPVAYLSGRKGLMALSSNSNILQDAFRNIWSLPAKQWNLNQVLGTLCSYSNFLSRPLCASLLNALTGATMENLDREYLGYYFQFFPDSSATGTVTHYYQVKNAGIFRQFDHGKWKNLAQYGSVSPPAYNISRIYTPVHMIYSDEDGVYTANDIARLKSELPNAYTYPIDKPWFSHLHFCWCTDIRNMVFKKIWKILTKN